MMNLAQVETREHIEEVKRLLREYEASLGINLCFQDFEREVAELPGEYAPPGGRLLLALDTDQAVGCVALRRIDDGTCEMKRLYLRPGFRGRGAGRLLAAAIIDEARKIGYRKMWLDTLPSMREAAALYESLGFGRIEPYYHNPIQGAIFMELKLDL